MSEALVIETGPGTEGSHWQFSQQRRVNEILMNGHPTSPALSNVLNFSYSKYVANADLPSILAVISAIIMRRLPLSYDYMYTCCFYGQRAALGCHPLTMRLLRARYSNCVYGNIFFAVVDNSARIKL